MTAGVLFISAGFASCFFGDFDTGFSSFFTDFASSFGLVIVSADLVGSFLTGSTCFAGSGCLGAVLGCSGAFTGLDGLSSFLLLPASSMPSVVVHWEICAADVWEYGRKGKMLESEAVLLVLAAQVFARLRLKPIPTSSLSGLESIPPTISMQKFWF